MALLNRQVRTGAGPTSSTGGGWSATATADPEAARTAWRHLEAEGVSTPFQTWGWGRALYTHIAPAKCATPLIVTIARAGSDEPALLLPLCVRRQGGLRSIEFADLGVSDYNAPLMARDLDLTPADRDAIWAGLKAVLPPADYISFEKAPASVEGVPNPFAELVCGRQHSFKSWAVGLPATWPLFEKQALSSHAAKELRRKTRLLGSHGEVRFARGATPETTCAMWSELVTQRGIRFAALGRENLLEQPAYRDFYRTVLMDSLPAGMVRIDGLWAGDALVATLFGLQHRGRFHLLMSTISEGPWFRAAPGHIAVARQIEQLIGEGCTLFDFTIGDERYKQDYSAAPTPLAFGMEALTLSGAPVVLAAGLGADLKDRARPLVHAMRARLKRKVSRR